MVSPVVVEVVVANLREKASVDAGDGYDEGICT